MKKIKFRYSSLMLRVRQSEKESSIGQHELMVILHIKYNNRYYGWYCRIILHLKHDKNWPIHWNKSVVTNLRRGRVRGPGRPRGRSKDADRWWTGVAAEGVEPPFPQHGDPQGVRRRQEGLQAVLGHCRRPGVDEVE